MEKTIQIDGRDVHLRSSAGIPRLYRIKFKRDIIQDMKIIEQAIHKSNDGAAIPPEALTLFENVAYLMAKHADPENVPSSVEDWLDSFETFSIYAVFPVIQELWADNLQTLSKPVKK